MRALLVAGVACGLIFAWLTHDVVTNEGWVRSDPGVMRFIVAHRVAWVTGFMKGITRLGSVPVLLPVVIVLGGYVLVKKRDWRPGVLLVVALAGATAWYDVVKPLVDRERPPVPLQLIAVSGRSFPSGHATAAIAVWGAVAVVLSSRPKPRLKAVVWIAAGLIATLVGFSRLYLGVHWWTDVVGGMALGGAWLCLLVAIGVWTAGDTRPPHHS
ncbi:MAG: phosphatase PAP2 family protein [Actinomycetota bacterium]|nr:phosphatase PAP2 family protein [Actinomycetota bacterium]